MEESFLGGHLALKQQQTMGLKESGSLSYLLKQRVTSHKLKSLPAADSSVLDGETNGRGSNKAKDNH